MPEITPELDYPLLVYLFWAYTAAFALLFAYVWSLIRRLGELEREVERLRRSGSRPQGDSPGEGAG